MSTGMTSKNREQPEMPLAPDAKPKDKMPKICAQAEEKVKSFDEEGLFIKEYETTREEYINHLIHSSHLLEALVN